jgi:hypothetical protein
VCAPLAKRYKLNGLQIGVAPLGLQTTLKDINAGCYNPSIVSRMICNATVIIDKKVEMDARHWPKIDRHNGLRKIGCRTTLGFEHR